jgi:two-component system, chemotaxis family, sensor kinase CheA
MSDLIENMWNQFALETDEYLEQIEPLLLLAQQDLKALDSEGIAQMFRSMHSAKGLARAMDMLSMESVAHYAEDLVGLVRDHNVPLNQDMVSLLLEALDQLHTLREVAITQRSNGSIEGDVLDRLATAYAQYNPTQKEVVTEASVNNDDISAVSNDEESLGLFADIDMDMLMFFAEIVDEKLPALSALFGDQYGSPESVDRVVEVLDDLILATDGMSFDYMSDLLQEIKDAQSDAPSSDDIKRQQTALLVDLFRVLNEFEKETSLMAGVVAFAARLLNTETEVMDAWWSQFATEVELLDSTSLATMSPESVKEHIDRIEVFSVWAKGWHTLLFPQHTCDVMLLLPDVYMRLTDDLNPLADDVVQHVLQVIEIVSGQCLSGEALSDEDMQPLVEQLQALILNTEKQQGRDDVDYEDFLESLPVSVYFKELLTADNLQELKESLTDATCFYEVMADFDTDTDVGMDIMQWIQSNQVITSRTILIEEASKFEFLLVSSNTLEMIQKELSTITTDAELLAVRVSGEALIDLADDVVKVNADGSLESPPPQHKSVASIRVNVDILDGFMNQIGEMVLIRGMLTHILENGKVEGAINKLTQFIEDSTTAGEMSESLKTHWDVFKENQQELKGIDSQLHEVLTRLQENALSLRVVPIGSVFNRLTRVTRDLAKQQNKPVQLKLEGTDVRVDKGMVDLLSEPLIHMIRNSVDHGIETSEERESLGKSAQATLVLSAVQKGERICINLVDDGRGVNTEKVLEKAIERQLVSQEVSDSLTEEQIHQFILEPGFSTAAELTETSGRGVGMDVVSTTITRLGGKLYVRSVEGEGTTISFDLPLSAAIQSTLVVKSVGQKMALPDRYVSEVVEVDSQQLHTIKGREAFLLRGLFLPLVRLDQLLGFSSDQANAVDQDYQKMAVMLPVVVLSNDKFRIGLVVDKIFSRQEFFLKNIHPSIAKIPGIGGVSILGNGKVILILDGEELFKLAAHSDLGGAAYVH